MADLQPTPTEDPYANETWKPVPGYEGCYEVSDCGRVRSVDREVQHKDGSSTWRAGRMLKGTVDRDGYSLVGLHREGHGRTMRVHRLVLLAFVGESMEGQYVCHENDVPGDNRLSNLRYGWPSDNSRDMVMNGGAFRMEAAQCSRGHDLSADNLVHSDWKDGHRKCLACSRAYDRTMRKGWSDDLMQSESDAEYRSILANGPDRILKTHCRRGHPIQEPNLVPSALKHGRRHCLACQRTHTYLQGHRELKPHFKKISDSYYEDIMRDAA